MASFTGSKKITQATFDEVVKENMEEFDMDVKEAIADAVKQFTSQAVDLTDIDLSGGVGKQDVLDAIARLVAPESDGATVVATVSPAHTVHDETMHTLRYAERLFQQQVRRQKPLVCVACDCRAP
jgi:histone H3/H4